MSSTHPARDGISGFTMIELIIVIMLLGILSVTALPKLTSLDVMVGAAFRDEAVAALRYAQKSAVAHRRLVCADFTAGTVSLSIASANPATSCGTALNGPDGNTAYATSKDVTHYGFSPVPSTLYFQPSGSVTSDAAGTTVVSPSLQIADQSNIEISGATGYVR